MKKEINQGVVIGILVIVGLIVAVWGWKALAPPAPPGIKPMSASEVKVAQQKHSQSVQDQQNQQMKLLKQSQGGQ